MFVNIPISMLVARKLGVDGQGVYAAAGAFPALWATVWIVGLDAAHTWALASNRTTLGPRLREHDSLDGRDSPSSPSRPTSGRPIFSIPTRFAPSSPSWA